VWCNSISTITIGWLTWKAVCPRRSFCLCVLVAVPYICLKSLRLASLYMRNSCEQSSPMAVATQQYYTWCSCWTTKGASQLAQSNFRTRCIFARSLASLATFGLEALRHFSPYFLYISHSVQPRDLGGTRREISRSTHSSNESSYLSVYLTR